MRRLRRANYEAPDHMAWRVDTTLAHVVRHRFDRVTDRDAVDAEMLNDSDSLSGHGEQVGIEQRLGIALRRGVHTDGPFPTHRRSFPPGDITSVRRPADNDGAMDRDSFSAPAA